MFATYDTAGNRIRRRVVISSIQSLMSFMKYQSYQILSVMAKPIIKQIKQKNVQFGNTFWDSVTWNSK